jgi:hypothetical protein
VSAEVPTELFAALERAEPLLLDALAPEGVVRVEYVVGFVPPYDVWVWLGTATDAERDALPGDMPFLDTVLTALREAGLPVADGRTIGTTTQSQETVDRDYESSWFYALR